ncbi:hypothetical protein X766_26105 [Mesorhizobium sp. LSJC255A00]|nr:hypothetical protein X766_26105 [Mesorhizobium sp. LSJC255A00]
MDYNLGGRASDSQRAKSLDLTQHGYAGQDPEKAKRALVEAVQLPSE